MNIRDKKRVVEIEKEMGNVFERTPAEQADWAFRNLCWALEALKDSEKAPSRQAA